MSTIAVAIRHGDSGVAHVFLWANDSGRLRANPLRAKSLGKGPRRVVSAPPVPPGPDDIVVRERIAELTRELPPEKQEETLEVLERRRSERGASAEPRRGSLEALHAMLAAAGPPPDDEPDWSPFDIEPADVDEPELLP